MACFVLLILIVQLIIFMFFYSNGKTYEIPQGLNWLGAFVLILITLPYQILRIIIIVIETIIKFLFTKKEKKEPKKKERREEWGYYP